VGSVFILLLVSLFFIVKEKKISIFKEEKIT